MRLGLTLLYQIIHIRNFVLDYFQVFTNKPYEVGESLMLNIIIIIQAFMLFKESETRMIVCGETKQW